VLAVLGPSGCGKSTLLRVVAGLQPLAAGSVHLDGAEVTGVPTHRRGVALVFQDGQLFPHMTVRANLLYGHDRRAAADRRLQLPQVVELLELSPLLDRRPAQLSGGERQRVALGRALLCSPRLMLLDEPLASLDDRLKQQILPFLRRVKDESGIPMLYVSHAAAEVEFIADRVLRMERGRIVGIT
jgi:molybdate transport system ATP-binding protein